ncbi:MAG TPA: hypothetical protein VG755_33885, partial [Nannocystaceae bacterium]|nr:hypothetical protein [Nannocystaceae bacterium]
QVMVPADDESTGDAETEAVGNTTTSSGSGTTSTGPVATSSSSTTSATTETTTGVDPDPSTSTTSTSESSSDEGGCSPTDECVVDDDCGMQGICIGCICIGGCELAGSGTYDVCLLPDDTTDTSACNDDTAVCVVNAAAMPNAGVCSSPCVEVCDCPPLPGYDAQIVCEDIGGAGQGQCLVTCGDGRCPPGMVCTMDAVCLWEG